MGGGGDWLKGAVGGGGGGIGLKGQFSQKMKILSSFTHPHVGQTDFFLLLNTKKIF